MNDCTRFFDLITPLINVVDHLSCIKDSFTSLEGVATILRHKLSALCVWTIHPLLSWVVDLLYSPITYISYSHISAVR